MVYFYIFIFRFLRFLAYPFEIGASIVKRLFEIGFLIYLWTLVGKGTENALSLADLSAYFLIASGVGELTMSKWGALESEIGKVVRRGQLSNYLIKPVRILPALYMNGLGRYGMRMFMAVISIFVGLTLNPPASIFSMFLFVTFFVLAILNGFGFNVLLGSLFFHLTEANGFSNAVQHIGRVFSGAFVPLTFFPESYKQIAYMTPFPAMVYAPVYAFSATSFTADVQMLLLSSFLWAVILNVSAFFVWRYSIKAYEAVGI